MQIRRSTVRLILALAITGIVVVTLAISVQGSTGECQTLTIGHLTDDRGPVVIDRAGSTDGSVRSAIVGHFVVGQVGDDESTQDSADVADLEVSAATVCVVDGAVVITITYGGGACVQYDGATGLWNGTTGDDNGCVTQAEYQAAYGSLDAVVSVDPEIEPEAPTVEQVFIDPFVRAELVGLTIE